jgi:hypothetical protein
MSEADMNNHGMIVALILLGAPALAVAQDGAVPDPSETVTSAPSAPTPPAQQAKAIGTAITLRAAGLRSRPTAARTADVIVPAETHVRLEAHLSNADGIWWYVTANGIGGGWQLESEVGDPQAP